MRRIRITLRCAADGYARKERERIIEFFDPVTGRGGLISFWRTDRGQLLVQPYRLDAGVIVRTAGQSGEPPEGGDH